MGRLMDSVMAALGLKPSDRVNITAETPAPSERHQQQEVKKLTPELEKMVAEIENELPSRTLGGFTFLPATPEYSKDKVADEKNTKEKKASVGGLPEVPVAATDGNEAEVPVAAQEEKTKEDPEDCFSCKVVGVGSGLGLSSVCLYMAKNNPQKLIGWRLASFRTGNIMLATLTGVMALCIAFDLNVASEEEVKAQEKRSIREQFEFEVNYGKRKLGLNNEHQQVPENCSKNASTEKS